MTRYRLYGISSRSSSGHVRRGRLRASLPASTSPSSSSGGLLGCDGHVDRRRNGDWPMPFDPIGNQPQPGGDGPVPGRAAVDGKGLGVRRAAAEDGPQFGLPRAACSRFAPRDGRCTPPGSNAGGPDRDSPPAPRREPVCPRRARGRRVDQLDRRPRWNVDRCRGPPCIADTGDVLADFETANVVRRPRAPDPATVAVERAAPFERQIERIEAV